MEEALDTQFLKIEVPPSALPALSSTAHIWMEYWGLFWIYLEITFH